MVAKIKSIAAREIVAERGLLGLEVTVTADDGAVGVATPESGVSTGRNEAVFLLDDEPRFHGTGVRRAVDAITQVIAPALAGMDVSDQLRVDRALCELDGTPDKSRLGANALVGVSLAVLKAAAKSAGLPLYRYIGGANACVLPIPIVFLTSGGRYRDPGTSRWFKPTYEFVAYGAGSYPAALEMSWYASDQAKRLFHERFGDKYVPTYFWQSLAGAVEEDRQLLDVMAESIVRCGYEDKMGIYFDCAADIYYDRERERYLGFFSPGEKTRDDLLRYYEECVNNYPIVSFEDPLHEEDFEGIAEVTRATGVEVVGDDLFTTNVHRLEQGIRLGAANSMVLKITQVGTVSEALAACRLALANGYNVHPCGSRGDKDSIGDFAVGLNAGQVRAGDHNRLLAIEAELGANAVWPGYGAFKGWRHEQKRRER